MKSVAEIRELSQKDRMGTVNAGDLLSGLVIEREPVVAPCPVKISGSGADKGPNAQRCADMVGLLKAANESDLNLSDLLVLLSYVGTAADEDGDCVIRLSHPVTAKMTGLNESSIKRAVGKLTKKGFLVRQQARKEKGCAATSLVSDKAFGLVGLEGGAAISGFSLEMQSLLIQESHEVIGLVKAAWDEVRMPDEGLNGLWRGLGRDLDVLLMMMRNRINEAREALMSAAELKDKRIADEAEGIFVIEADDGEVSVSKAVVHAYAQFSHADVKFGVETLNLLSKVKPGMVTCQRAPELLAEVLYSRTIGFAVKGDYGSAQTFLINTMRKNWGRPKSIRDYWYVATKKACSVRLSTRGSISVH